MERLTKYLIGGTALLVAYTLNMHWRMSNALDLSRHLCQAKQIVPRAKIEYEDAKVSLNRTTVTHNGGETFGADTRNFYVALMNKAQQDMVNGILLESDLTKQIQSEKRKAFTIF